MTVEGVGTVKMQVQNGVGWLVIDNPRRRNALSTAMMRQLSAGLRAFEEDSTVKVIVIRGDGDIAFAAGADISEFEGQQGSEELRAANDAAVLELFEALDTATKPLLAMIHGFCFGAGVAIALACDLRVADQRARFAIPAARLGLGYPVTLTASLVRAVGPQIAAHMLFTGGTLRADQALSTGLVTDLLPPDGLAAHVRTLAGTIADNAPLSVAAAKAAIRCVDNPAHTARAAALVAACAASEDVREGQRAFMQRRAPQFSGE